VFLGVRQGTDTLTLLEAPQLRWSRAFFDRVAEHPCALLIKLCESGLRNLLCVLFSDPQKTDDKLRAHAVAFRVRPADRHWFKLDPMNTSACDLGTDEGLLEAQAQLSDYCYARVYVLAASAGPAFGVAEYECDQAADEAECDQAADEAEYDQAADETDAGRGAKHADANLAEAENSDVPMQTALY